MASAYECLRLEGGPARVTVTLDAPPVHVMTLGLFIELDRLGRELAAMPELRVVVVRSADPEFFIAHFDVEAILGFPIDRPAEPEAPGENAFHVMCERFRTLPAITIAQIEGRVGGGGSEWVQAFDMRFGVLGRTRINQMEVPLGILPGGGGTQHLPRIVGRARALEIIAGGADVDAATAERWGLLNRALEADAIGPFVDALADRIAGFPTNAVRLAKQAVNAAEGPLAEGLAEESFLFQQTLRDPEAQRRMRRFLEEGGQTREGERDVAALADRLGE